VVNNKKINNMEKKEIYGYGELLAYALDKKLLAYSTYGSYSGDYIAILDSGDNIEIWKGYYGSCSGCDWIEAQKNWEDETITKTQALNYVKDEKPFLSIKKRNLKVLIDSENIEAFFPANTRNDYTEWNWENIKKLLKESLDKESGK